jgi:signal transduction histidine kinase
MKLSAYYNRYNMITTISVLLLGSVIYFFALNYIIQNQLDRELNEEMEEVTVYINIHQKLPEQTEFENDEIVFTPTNQKTMKTIYTTAFYKNTDEKNDDEKNGRAIESIIQLNGKYYKTSITIPKESTEYFVQIIAAITLTLMIGLFLILFLINRHLSNGLWEPFFLLLHQLKSFNVSETMSANSVTTNVDELNELANTINSMSLRVKNDFKTLKQFTENASHEMMTPLAVITSKLDTLIQDESLKPEHYQQIQDIYGATHKLSRLNHSLLLLVKIENNLFEETEQVSLDQLIYEKIDQCQELINSRNIVVTTDIKQKSVMANKYLMDILLNNLFSNAVRHNNDAGSFIIEQSDTELTFRNSGTPLPLNKEKAFERFQKGKKSEGTGLGLAIVWNICKIYNWSVNYTFDKGLHSFQIVF